MMTIEKAVAIFERDYPDMNKIMYTKFRGCFVIFAKQKNTEDYGNWYLINPITKTGHLFIMQAHMDEFAKCLNKIRIEF